MLKTKFAHPSAGEKISIPIGKKGLALWVIRCCDCGLTHSIIMRPLKRSIQLGAWRHDDLLHMVLPKKHYKPKKK